MPELSIEQATCALQQMLDELARPEVKERIEFARQEAGGDVGKIIQKVVVIFYEINGHVMAPFGFEADDDGFAAFAEQLKKHESDPLFFESSQRLKTIMKASTMPLIDTNDEDDDNDATLESHAVSSASQPVIVGVEVNVPKSPSNKSS